MNETIEKSHKNNLDNEAFAEMSLASLIYNKNSEIYRIKAPFTPLFQRVSFLLIPLLFSKQNTLAPYSEAIRSIPLITSLLLPLLTTIGIALIIYAFIKDKYIFSEFEKVAKNKKVSLINHDNNVTIIQKVIFMTLSILIAGILNFVLFNAAYVVTIPIFIILSLFTSYALSHSIFIKNVLMLRELLKMDLAIRQNKMH